MGEIVALQYKISSLVLEYISENLLPYYSNINPEFAQLYPEFFKISETQGMLFITTFLLSIFAFGFGRLIGKITGFHAFKPEKFRLVLFVNIFYIIPFAYGLIGGRFNIINIFLMFLGSGAYFAFQYVITHPNIVIDYFTSNGI